MLNHWYFQESEFVPLKLLISCERFWSWDATANISLTHNQLEMHGYALSIVATDTQGPGGLKHQAISIHSAE